YHPERSARDHVSLQSTIPVAAAGWSHDSGTGYIHNSGRPLPWSADTTIAREAATSAVNQTDHNIASAPPVHTRWWVLAEAAPPFLPHASAALFATQRTFPSELHAHPAVHHNHSWSSWPHRS